MTTDHKQDIQRWRLILGKAAEESLCEMGGCASGSLLSGEEAEIDEALGMIYSGEGEDELSKDEWESGTGPGPHGAMKGRQVPKVAKWLGQIRDFFPRTWSS